MLNLAYNCTLLVSANGNSTSPQSDHTSNLLITNEATPKRSDVIVDCVLLIRDTDKSSYFVVIIGQFKQTGVFYYKVMDDVILSLKSM